MARTPARRHDGTPRSAQLPLRLVPLGGNDRAAGRPRFGVVALRADRLLHGRLVAALARARRQGDVVEVDFPMSVEFEHLPRRKYVVRDFFGNLMSMYGTDSSQGTVVRRGPLLYAYPIPTKREEDTAVHANLNGKKPGNPDFPETALRQDRDSQTHSLRRHLSPPHGLPFPRAVKNSAYVCRDCPAVGSSDII